VLLKIQGAKGYPDRILLTPKGHAVFLEFKSARGQLMPLQLYRLSMLRKMGFVTSVIRSKETFVPLLTFLVSQPDSGILASIRSEALTGS